jgi:hypothetical protein
VTLLPPPPSLRRFLQLGEDPVVALAADEQDRIATLMERVRCSPIPRIDVVDRIDGRLDELGLLLDLGRPLPQDLYAVVRRARWLAEGLDSPRIAALFVATCPLEAVVAAWAEPAPRDVAEIVAAVFDHATQRRPGGPR